MTGTTRALHLVRGVDAERAALEHLLEAGLRLHTTNFRCRSGEIDLVMIDRDELVFIEVRYRRSDAFGGAVQSVNAAKQRKLRMTAEYFMLQHPDVGEKGCRFDVIGASGAPPEYRFDWIKDAF